jgi:pimeloyl-ACP methyl ester carboxylesterase
MPLPHDTTTADETADRIGDIVAANGLTTPVIVAHSLSTYVVQKFLESYSPSAIVLINPIPRIPTATCDKLTVKKGDYFTLDADQRRLYSTGKAYENLLVNLKDPKSALEVEPGM